MLKRTLAAVSVAALMASPSLAQTVKNDPAQPGAAGTMSQPDTTRMNQMPPAGMPAQTMTEQRFVDRQAANEWLASKLIGASVKGAQNESIGEINEILIDSSGGVKAVVIGVGGFLGIGEKDVAVPFEALTVARKVGSDTVESVTVRYTKQELEQAPTFKTTAELEKDGAARPTTGAAGTSNPNVRDLNNKTNR